MSSGPRRLVSTVRDSIGSSIRMRQENAVVRRRKDCAQLFVVFKGLQDGLMMEPTRFLAESDLLSRNLVLLRDPHRAFYQRGISPAIRDFDALVGWLAALREELPQVAELHCVGASLGAFAAVAAGARLGADSVHAFGLMTNLAKTRIGRRSSLVEKLRGTDADIDLQSLLRKYNGRTAYHVYFGKDNKLDRRRAERAAGLPGVRLIPVPGNSHNIVDTLSRRDGLRSLFPPYRGVEGLQ